MMLEEENATVDWSGVQSILMNYQQNMSYVQHKYIYRMKAFILSAIFNSNTSGTPLFNVALFIVALFKVLYIISTADNSISKNKKIFAFSLHFITSTNYVFTINVQKYNND